MLPYKAGIPGLFYFAAARPGGTIPRMDWSRFRDEFPVTRQWAFLDHAAVAPLSAPARAALRQWADDMADNGVVINYVANNAGSRFKTVSDTSFTPEQYGIAVKKGNAELLAKLNQGLTTIRADGTYQAIYAKYFGAAGASAAASAAPAAPK